MRSGEPLPLSSGRKSLLLAAGLAVVALGAGLLLRMPETSTVPSEFAELKPGVQVGNARLTSLSWASVGLIRVELERAEGQKVQLELMRDASGRWSLAPADGGDEALARALLEKIANASGGPRDGQPEGPGGDSNAVIPPGQEALVAQMLGKDVELPGGCHWDGASIERTAVKSRYRCGTEQHELTLCHPTGACADEAAAFTGGFALAGTLPPALLEALTDRVQEREGSFHWEGAVDDVGALGRPATPFPALLWFAVAGAMVASIFAAAAGRSWLARGPSVSLNARPAPLRLALWSTLTLALFAVSNGSLRAWGALLWGLVHQQGASRAALLLPMFGLAIVSGLLVAVVTTLRAPGPAVVRVLVLASLYLAVAWPLSLSAEPLRLFGKVSTLPAGTSPYATNSQGFRGGEWLEPKPAGVLRVGLIGGSFVEGSGLTREEDTLSAQLAAELRRRFPERPLEVLNLGISGDNLTSHVDLLESSVGRLGLDLVVLCLTNEDLSPWDGQLERRDAGRLSAFSFTRLLLGEGAPWLLARLRSPLAGRSLAQFARPQLSRLRGIASAHHVLLFSFTPPSKVFGSLLARTAPGSRLVMPPPLQGNDFLPEDGRPTPAGNLRFAAAIADGLADDLAAQAK